MFTRDIQPQGTSSRTVSTAADPVCERKQVGSPDEHHSLNGPDPEIYRLNITVCSIIQKKEKKKNIKKEINFGTFYFKSHIIFVMMGEKKIRE